MPGLSGRRAEAARNDALVLEAAREVLIATPEASMSQISERAGVGIGTLYRRYPSKEVLVQQLCLDAMARVEAATRAALAHAEDDPWAAFAAYMEGAVAAGAGALQRLAGSFRPSPEVEAAGARLGGLTQELLARAQAAGAVRTDVTLGDIALLLEELRAIRVRDPGRVGALQRRHLALLLQALRAPGAAPLPGAAPTWEEISGRWTPDA